MGQRLQRALLAATVMLSAACSGYTVHVRRDPNGSERSRFSRSVRKIYLKTTYEHWSPGAQIESDTFIPEALASALRTLQGRGYETVVLPGNAIEYAELGDNYDIVGLTPTGVSLSAEEGAALVMITTNYNTTHVYYTTTYDSEVQVGSIKEPSGETIATLYRPVTETEHSTETKHKAWARAYVFIGGSIYCDRYVQVSKNDLAGVVKATLDCVARR